MVSNKFLIVSKADFAISSTKHSAPIDLILRLFNDAVYFRNLRGVG
jgi:hypothetical protein